MSFLQPCLLHMLQQGDGHGYSLFSRLEEFGFRTERLDASLVYRALREMETAGWISSYPGDESQGPQRRIYQLTDEGQSHLKTWVEDLRRAKREIEALLTAYERHTKSS